MKKWSIILVVLLTLVCLASCGRQEVIPGRPHAMEVSYGEKSIHAVTGGYVWNWEDGKAETDSIDPRQNIQRLPALSSGDAQNISLDFAVSPDILSISQYSAEDGYTESQPVTPDMYTFAAPVDGQDHIFSVTALWNENEAGWGSCTYHFLFLDQALDASDLVIEDIGDLDLASILAMGPDDFLGIEFTNYVDDGEKTCTTGKDKGAILDFLQENIPTELKPVDVSKIDTKYALRLVSLDGAQLTICIGTDGRKACLQAGGAFYELQPMELTSLWNELQAGSVSAAAAASGKGYLDVSETDPMIGLQSEPAFTYITALDSDTVISNDVHRFESQDSPTGYRYEPGWQNIERTLSPDCEFWVLDDNGTYGKVTADGLLRHNEYAEEDVLYCIYTGADDVIAICQKPQD